MDTNREVRSASFRDRESFALSLLTHLDDVLQTVIGLEEAEGFVSTVAARMAQEVSRELEPLRDAPKDVARRIAAEALVTLKAQIGGHFEIESLEKGRVVFRGCACPFGDRVKGRESLCRMTSVVFGRVMADTTGYARVAVRESIARGHEGCHVVVDLVPPDSPEAADPYAVEYFRADDFGA